MRLNDCVLRGSVAILVPILVNGKVIELDLGKGEKEREGETEKEGLQEAG